LKDETTSKSQLMPPFPPVRDDSNQVFQGDLFQDIFTGADVCMQRAARQQECIPWHQYRQQESVQDSM
jgi:hypothetical protein